MGTIFRVNETEIPWSDFRYIATAEEPGQVRYKALTGRGSEAPPMQYVEYAPGHRDPAAQARNW